MGLAAELRRAWVVFSLTVRYLLVTRRVLATAAVASIPVVLAASLAAAQVRIFDILLFQLLMVPLFLQVVLIFVALVPAVALLREEIEDNTLPYYLVRPISKPALAGYKYLGYLAATLVLLIPPLVAAYAITQAYAGSPFTADLDVLSGFLAATILGGAAYGAFFELLSVLIRRPLAVGLLFGFVWESIVGMIPGDVPRLSIIHYLRSILKGMIPIGPLSGYRTDVKPTTASAILVGVAATALFLTMLIFQASEFKQKE
jgi:ABC-type transport system involved in multi-copper enzyme maturation permease subunit